MQFLIDTHVVIWFLEGNDLLSASNRQLISNPANDIFVSIASIWEIAIKTNIGKLVLSDELADVIKQITSQNMEILAISPDHVLQVSSLPFHHRDPFDRMTVSQAIVEDLNLISADAQFDAYLADKSVVRIW